MTDEKNEYYNELRDKKISIAILAPFVVLMIQYLLLVYFNLFGSSVESIIKIISKVIVGVFYLTALKYVLKRGWKVFFTVYYLFFLIILVNFILYPDNINTLFPLLFNILFVTTPTFIYTLNIKNYEVFKRVLFKFSDFILMVGVSFLIMLFLGKINMDNYSMSLGYYLLLPLLVNLIRFFSHFNFLSLLNSILMITTITLTGSRGPFLSIVIFIILFFLIRYRTINAKRIINGFILLLIGGITILKRDTILQTIIKYLGSIGFESRTLSLFEINEPGIHLSGREDIYGESLNLINEKPFLGWGLTGEVQFTNTYAHNIFLEIFISFGIIVGAIIIVSYAVLFFNVLLKASYPNQELIILLFSIGFIPLLVSGTYLTDIQFWILLGAVLKLSGNLKL